MTKEEENKHNRKSMPLTNSESLTFFFFPFRFFGRSDTMNNDFAETEMERFNKFGFDLKSKQAKNLTFYGRLFYLGIIFFIFYLFV